ncbi:unnamed protein product, partial [Allacma fusca]
NKRLSNSSKHSCYWCTNGAQPWYMCPRSPMNIRTEPIEVSNVVDVSNATIGLQQTYMGVFNPSPSPHE